MTGTFSNTGISIIIFGSSGSNDDHVQASNSRAARNECNGCRALLLQWSRLHTAVRGPRR